MAKRWNEEAIPWHVKVTIYHKSKFLLPFPRGWIANEVFRRVHPAGATIGEFLREKVSGPLGARAFVGVRQEELADYAPGKEMKMPFLFGHSLLPKALGSGVDYGPIELFSLFYEFSKLVGEFKVPMKGLDNSKGMGYFWNMVGYCRHNGNILLFIQDIVRRGESSSTNGNCSARGKLYYNLSFSKYLLQMNLFLHRM